MRMESGRHRLRPHRPDGSGPRPLAVATVALALLLSAGSAAAVYHAASSETSTSMSGGAGDVKVVKMTNGLRFEPAELTIQVGDTVEWRNVSNIPHTATADPSMAADPDNVDLPPGAESFDSKLMRGGRTYRRTFDTPGEYRYVCVPHERSGMLGRIVVK